MAILNNVEVALTHIHSPRKFRLRHIRPRSSLIH
jgi:hypothetical protein